MLIFSVGADIHLSNRSSEVAVLKVSFQLDTPMKVTTDVVQSSAKPSQTLKFVDNSETLKEVFEAMKQMIDALTGVGDISWVNLYYLMTLFTRCTLQLPLLGDFYLLDLRWVSMVFPVHRYLHIIDAGKYYRISIMWSMLYLIFMQTWYQCMKKPAKIISYSSMMVYVEPMVPCSSRPLSAPSSLKAMRRRAR